jgi:alpha-2-macroglobulin
MSTRVLLALVSLFLFNPATAFAEADEAREAMMGGSYRRAAAMLGGEAAKAAGDPVSGPHLRYLQGRALQLAGDHRGAVRAFERLLKDFPESPWARKARFCRADSLVELGNAEASAATYREETDALLGVERRDEIGTLFLTYAHAAFEPDEEGSRNVSPDYPTARTLFATVLELEPSEAMAHEAEHYQARCDLEMGRHDVARRLLADRLDREDNPLAAADRFHLARASAWSDPADAIRHFHLVMKLHQEAPEAADALWEAALLEAPEGRTDALDPEGAVGDLRALVTGHPDHERAAEAHLRIPRVLVATGRLAAAAVAYAEYVDAPARAGHEDRPQAMVELARLHERLGNDDDALAVYRAYSAGYPTHAEWAAVQIHLSDRDQRDGYALYRAGELDAAVEAFERYADAHAAEDADARYLIGLIRYRQGRIDDAAQTFEAVASKFPYHPSGSRAQYALATLLLEQRRDVDGARDTLQDCMDNGGVRYSDCSTLLYGLDAEALDLYADRPLRTDEKPRVWLRARNLEEVELTLHRVDPEILMRKEGSVEAMDALDVELIEPDRRWRVELDGATDGLTFADLVELPDRTPGVYVVGATGKTLRAQIPVVISDITVASHRQGADVLVYVQDRRRGRPVSGARVLLSDGAAVFGEGRTGADGTWLHSPDPGGTTTPPRVVALALKGQQMATAVVDGYDNGKPENLPVASYVYTDRSAYRPGATVGYRAVVRRVADRRSATLASARARVTLRSPQGWTVADHEVRLDRFGALSGDLELDPEYGSGQYALDVDVRVDDGWWDAGTAGFEVTEVAPSRRQVTIDLDRSVYVLGDDVVATVTAATYTGEPIEGVQLAYHWAHTGEHGKTEPTDIDGHVTLRTSTLNQGGRGSIALTVALPGEPVEVNETALVRDAEFAIELELDRSTVQTGEAVHALLRSVGADGEAVPADLQVALHHTPRAVAASAWNGNPFDQPLWEQESHLVPTAAAPARPTEIRAVSTDTGDGTSLDWRLDAPGEWRIVAVGRDARGHMVRSEARVTAVEGTGPLQGLALLADETHLPASGEARIRVLGAGPGPVLSIVDADGIAAKRVHTLRADGDALVVTLDTSLAPTARVTVVALREDRVATGQVDLTLDAHLVVDVGGIDGEVAPGQRLATTLRVTDEAGDPVDAQLSVAVVDASLLAQFPERRGHSKGVFLPATHAVDGTTAGATELRTTGPGVQIDADILAEMERMNARRDEAGPIRPEDIGLYEEAEEVYWLDDANGLAGLSTTGRGGGGSGYGSAGGKLGYASGGVVGGAGLGRAAQIRRFRSEAAFWVGDLATGADGVVELPIDLPGHPASWRIIAVAFDRGQRSGEVVEEVTARAPLSVALATPPFVREGDRPSLMADLIADGGGDYQLEGALGETTFSAVTRALPGRGPLPVALLGAPVSASDATRGARGELLVPFHLSLTGPLGTATDELGSPVVSADVPLERWTAGRLAQAMDLTIQPPEGAAGDLEMILELSPASLPGTLALALARPNVCWRSPYTSAHMAFAATALLEGAGSRSLPREQADMVRSLARSYLLELIEDPREFSQQWSQPGYGHDGALTAYGYVALVRAQRLDLLPPEASAMAADKASQARQTLLRKLREDGSSIPERQALLLYALSFGGGDEGAAAALTRQLREPGSAVALGRLASAAVRMGMRDEVGGLHGDLEEAMRGALARGSWADLAAVTEGLHAVDPGNPLLDDAAEAIEAQLDRPWLSTQAVASLGAALARLQGSGGSASAVKVTLPDGTVQRVDFSRETRAVRIASTVPQGPAEVVLEPSGRGSIRYRLGLAGRPGADAAPADDPRITLERRYQRPDVRFQGVPIPQGFGVMVGQHERWIDDLRSLPVGQETQVTVRLSYGRDQSRDPAGTVWIVEEMIPGGAVVVPGSVNGVVHAEIHPDRIVATVDGNRSGTTLSYRLEGRAPGSWTVPATLVRRMDDGQLFEVGAAASVEVGSASAAAEDAIAGVEYPAGEHRLTPDELFGLGTRLSEDERWADTAALLGELLEQGSQQRNRATELAAILLRAQVELEDRAGTLRAFEMLKELDPAHSIPFEQVVAVAQAYEELGEHRRAIRVYRTTLAAQFLTEARLGRTLEQESLVLPSLRFVYDLSTAYPDLSPVQSSLFHLPQIWADRAEYAASDPAMRSRGYTRATLLATSADWMLEFAARYPESPLAEEAGFHLTGTYLELERNAKAVATARSFSRRFRDGPYLDDLLYMEGHARLDRGESAAALALLGRVATEDFTLPGGGAMGPSEQRPLALYSMAQIHDAAGQVERALDRYTAVSGHFRDAAEAVARLEQVTLAADEVTNITLDRKPLLTVRSRNVPSVDLLLYRVDLMRLYLRDKDLSHATSVRLAGIDPAHQRSQELEGSSYRERGTDVALPLERPGAYLVMLKGEHSDISAMVLYSDLALEIQEDRSARRVRVVVTDPSGDPVEDAHVKVIGSSGGTIVSGDTDLRGVFAADGVSGIPTVIARRGEHYAFWRGPDVAPPPPYLPGMPAPVEVDLLEKVRQQGATQRQRNRASFDDAFYAEEVQGVSIGNLE